MKVTVCDLTSSLADAWPHEVVAVSALTGSILDVKCDAYVSPANSFGFMDGGVDYAYSRRFGWQVQGWLQDQLKLRPFGELLVGEAIMVPTGDADVPYVISAPTMRVPKRILDVADIFLASRAATRLARDAGLAHIAFPGMGTGCGDVPFEQAAQAMAKGIAAGLAQEQAPISWQEAQERHFAIGASLSERERGK